MLTVAETNPKSPPCVVYGHVLATALAAAVVAFGIDIATSAIVLLRESVEHALTLQGVPWLIACCLSRMPLAACANAAVCAVPQAKGSGILDIKCILRDSDNALYDTLGISLLTSKAIGLVCGLGAGLPLGKVGPFVHIAACISAEIGKRTGFKTLDLDRRTRIELPLLAAAASGIGTTFGACLGGGLFGLELMMPHLIDLGLCKVCFMASLASSLLHRVLLSLLGMKLHVAPFIMSDANFTSPRAMSNLLILVALCMCTGVCCGCLGAFWVRFQIRTAAMLARLTEMASQVLSSPRHMRTSTAAFIPLLSQSNRLTHPAVVVFPKMVLCMATASACIGFVVIGVEGTHTCLLSHMLSAHNLNLSGSCLCMLFASYFFASAVAISLPIPSGVVAPALIMGAVAGRCLSRLLCLPYAVGFSHEDEALIAVIAASAFGAAVCRTFSLGLCIFEALSLPSEFILPLTLGTMTSVFVADAVSASHYDAQKELALRPRVKSLFETSDMIHVSSLMQVDVQSRALPRKCTVLQLRQQSARLSMALDKLEVVGIVEQVSELSVLLGTIKIGDLHHLCESLGQVGVEEIDLLNAAISRKLCTQPVLVEPEDPVDEAYHAAQRSDCGGVLFVAHAGQLVGILPVTTLRAALCH